MACTKKSEQATFSDQEKLIKRGRMIYSTQCAACHNHDPKLDGALGPAVFGSSIELIELRVLKGTYPEGYPPKRATKTMSALPHLKDEIPALHAYLNSTN